jgi:hypothetical protein
LRRLSLWRMPLWLARLRRLRWLRRLLLVVGSLPSLLIPARCHYHNWR